MKKFFKEFGEFIKRGNVLDLAVGVIIGGAFSAIVTALTNNILMPIINFVLSAIFGKNGMEGAITVLGEPVYTLGENGEKILDLANTIYINWGAFITAIINFILIALVLFLIVKAINNVSKQLDINSKMKERLEEKMRKGDRFTAAEERWVKRMKENHPEMVPVIETEAPAPAEPEAPVPTETERLLAEILSELKDKK
ncbi:MAG: large conductance mechanosensitive channel protein MscL [Clostridia bacterium]|nr:large conductance mechanosensitive channel protein MscL [Clostridia bacterium]